MKHFIANASLVLPVFLLFSAAAPAVAQPLNLVRDGKAMAVVVVDRDTFEQDQRLQNPLTNPRATHPLMHHRYPDRLTKFRERHVLNAEWPFNEPGSVYEAATVLVEMIRRATGAELPIVFAPPAEGNAIYIGNGEAVRRFGIDQSGLDMDAFDICFPNDRSAVILGPGKTGVEFGAYEFLERFVGVRWLMPGEDGVDVPEQRHLVVPRQDIRQEPVFWSRRWSAGYPTWSRRLRMHNRQPCFHFLWALFWVEDYIESHPHFYPMRSGRRMSSVPGYTRSTARNWQPCFSADGIAEEAVNSIVEYFDLNPRSSKYYPMISLGVNDGTENYCRCPECLAQITGEKNVQGFTDYSAPYFRWVNAVADGVAEKHPDKYLHTIAYQHTFEAPDFELHPSVVVGITYDWMRLLDPETRVKIEGVLKNWSEKADVIQTTEYLYGRFYLAPRIYTRFLADLYRMMHQNKVQMISSQAGFHLGEVPKYYAAAKLKWNPYLDVNALMDDWYLHCVGERAAPYLKQYFDFWEHFWTRRIPDTDWGKHLRGGGTFLPFRHSARAPTYLLDVTAEEMAQLRGWMEQAVAKADPGVRRRRAETLFLTFEYYESTRLLYEAAELAFDDPAALAERFEPWIAAARTREHLIEDVFPNTTGLESVRYTASDMPFLGFDQVVRVLWKHRDLIHASEDAKARLAAAVRADDDNRLKAIVARIAALGDVVDIDPHALWRGLVLHLPLNDGQGVRAGDRGPSGNHGTIENPQWVEDTPGGAGYSLGFGPDTRITCPHHDSLNTEQAQTISVWIKLNDLGTHGWYWMFSKASRAGHDATVGWLLSGTHGDHRPDYGGRIEPRANAGGSWGPIGPIETLPAERWFHVVATYHHEKGGQTYVDALPVSPTGTRGRGKLAINKAPLTVRHGDGMLYDLRIYNRALTENEVVMLYARGKQP